MQFQRIARINKKAFFNEQCKEIEENNRMKKIESSSRKLEISREQTFQARTDTIKDRNGKDLTEEEEIKKRWQEYQKNCTEKVQITMMVWSFT